MLGDLHRTDHWSQSLCAAASAFYYEIGRAKKFQRPTACIGHGRKRIGRPIERCAPKGDSGFCIAPFWPKALRHNVFAKPSAVLAAITPKQGRYRSLLA